MGRVVMAEKVKGLEADVVITGGGPGGCTIAKELSKKGKKVILVEQGGASKRFLGTPFGILTRLEKGLHFPFPVKRTVEGDNLILAKCVGGGTVIYAGSAFPPNMEYWEKHGIDIPQELVDEAMEETWSNLPPDDFIGPGTRRIWEAAGDLGLPYKRLYRHVDFTKCKLGCEDCTLGCSRDAKWTGAVFMEEAVKNGATLLTHTKVREVIIEDGVAGGVRAVGKGGTQYEIEAKVVVCSAGGAIPPRYCRTPDFPRPVAGSLEARRSSPSVLSRMARATPVSIT